MSVIKFNEDELIIIESALEIVMTDIQNHITNCPYPEMFSTELETYNAELENIRKIHDKLNSFLKKSGQWDDIDSYGPSAM